MKTLHIGIDLGATSAKCACFRGEGKAARLEGFSRFDIADEGILNEAELYAALKDSLAEKRMLPARIDWVLPQYQVTANVADYPTNVHGARLARLVAQETRQLGGISDEAFVYGYAEMPAGHGRQHPVLIAMSREDGIREKLTALSSAGLDCEKLAPAGVALAAGGLGLVQGLDRRESPVMLLDIGHENTTVVIMASGQILYLGTLMFNAGNLEKAATAYLESHPSARRDGDILQYLSGIRLKDESPQSPVHQAVMVLESEMQGVVEHWRSQENDTLANEPITHVILSGGGSRLGGLSEWLAEVLECEVTVVGPEDGGEVCPELTIAYGAGLMACGGASIDLSLMPADILDLQRRKRRWPFAAAALGLLLASAIGTMGVRYARNLAEIKNLEERQGYIQECVDLANKHDDKLAELQKHLGSTALLVAPGARGRRLSRALAFLADCPLKNGWLVYLSDGATVHEDEDFFAVKSQAVPVLSSQGAAPQAITHSVSLADVNADKEFVCSGFVPINSREEIRSLMDWLGEPSSAFSGIDRGDSLEFHAPGLVWKWREYLNRQEARLRKTFGLKTKDKQPFYTQFEMFTLRMPVREPDFGIPVGKDVERVTEKKRKRGK